MPGTFQRMGPQPKRPTFAQAFKETAGQALATALAELPAKAIGGVISQSLEPGGGLWQVGASPEQQQVWQLEKQAERAKDQAEIGKTLSEAGRETAYAGYLAGEADIARNKLPSELGRMGAETMSIRDLPTREREQMGVARRGQDVTKRGQDIGYSLDTSRQGLEWAMHKDRMALEMEKFAWEVMRARQRALSGRQPVVTPEEKDLQGAQDTLRKAVQEMPDAEARMINGVPVYINRVTGKQIDQLNTLQSRVLVSARRLRDRQPQVYADYIGAYRTMQQVPYAPPSNEEMYFTGAPGGSGLSTMSLAGGPSGLPMYPGYTEGQGGTLEQNIALARERGRAAAEARNSQYPGLPPDLSKLAGDMSADAMELQLFYQIPYLPSLVALAGDPEDIRKIKSRLYGDRVRFRESTGWDYFTGEKYPLRGK